MATKIAVAVIHGVGAQESDYAEPMIENLIERFVKEFPDSQNARDHIVLEPVHWAPILQKAQNRLWRKVSGQKDLDYIKLRKFMVGFAGDAIAYQPTPRDRKMYDDVHAKFAQTLHDLSKLAGPNAPLCIIAHSLGTVVASNFLYDLQNSSKRGLISPQVRHVMGRTALERGHTLALFYTLGSPIALWSLRYEGFGRPIRFPPPRLKQRFPRADPQWINYYDADDVIAFPLRPLNAKYKKAVTRDVEVNVGSLFSSWNPMSHTAYWTDRDITVPIAKSLVKLWRACNEAN